ncbi:MAG: ATP-binding cassette domain-containing protein, partial [Actinomycetes bacterium]
TPRYRAMALLEQLSIDHLADKPALQVSGGEGQRAAIARALVHEPSVIFADEPTGALDVANGGKVLGLLREMTDLRNITTVLVTHDTKIADASDRCVELIDGEVRIDRRTLMDSL